MKRTYNVYVDNGLYYVANFLEKKIEEITDVDIINALSGLTKQLVALTDNRESTAYKIGNMVYGNSPINRVTMNKKIYPTFKDKEEYVGGKYKELATTLSNERYCIICGEKKVPEYTTIGKDYFPATTARSFYNNANNLQTVDICPICTILASISIVYYSICGPYGALYITENDELMELITDQIQDKIENEMLLNVPFADRRKNLINLCCEYASVAKFAKSVSLILTKNSAKENDYLEYTINNPKIQFVINLKYKGLLEIFYEFNLDHNIFEGTMLRGLINSIKGNRFERLLEDKKEKEAMELLRKIKELKKEIESFELPEAKRKLVDRTVQLILEVYSMKKAINEIRNKKGVSDLRTFLIKCLEEGKTVLTTAEIMEMTNGYKAEQYRDMVLIELILKKKEDELKGIEYENEDLE